MTYLFIVPVTFFTTKKTCRDINPVDTTRYALVTLSKMAAPEYTTSQRGEDFPPFGLQKTESVSSQSLFLKKIY